MVYVKFNKNDWEIKTTNEELVKKLMYIPSFKASSAKEEFYISNNEIKFTELQKLINSYENCSFEINSCIITYINNFID